MPNARNVAGAERGHADVGTDLIQYAFQITNAGGVVLHDVTIDDPLFGGTIYGPVAVDSGAFLKDQKCTSSRYCCPRMQPVPTPRG